MLLSCWVSLNFFIIIELLVSFINLGISFYAFENIVYLGASGTHRILQTEKGIIGL